MKLRRLRLALRAVETFAFGFCVYFSLLVLDTLVIVPIILNVTGNIIYTGYDSILILVAAILAMVKLDRMHT